MSFNGSGTFVINSAGQPVVSGTVISSTAFNALTADLANGLSTCITKDGQTTPTADIPMGSNKITGLANGTAAGDAANLGQVQSTVAKLLGSVSGADTITAVGAPTVAAYAAGQMFYFVAAAANTGAVTINIDSLGAKSITRDGTTALAAGDIQSGEVCVIVYDGTQFQLVNGASQSAAIVTNSLTVNGTSSLDGAVTINDSGADVDFRVESDTNDHALFVQGSDGNVGIGTSSPVGRLVVTTTATGAIANTNFRNIVIDDNTNSGMTILSGTASIGAINFGDSDDNDIGSVRYSHSDNALLCFTNAAERMRIASDGSVGIGTSSPGAKIEATASGAVVQILNRTTSDGGILQFEKDGSEVGSIGSRGSGTSYIILKSSSGSGSGLTGSDNTILPMDESALADNNTSLGSGSYRFKDLYLSGGVYLGGTGASNQLDDYEEGTWTPTYVPTTGAFASVTYDAITSGKYTKIGNKVFIEGVLRTDAISVGTASGSIKVGGLPFTSSANYAAVDMGYAVGFVGETPSSGLVDISSTEIFLYYRSTADGPVVSLNVTDLDTGTNDNYIIFSASYTV